LLNRQVVENQYIKIIFRGAPMPLFAFFPLLILATVIVFFVIFVKQNSKKLPVEMDKNLVYTENCGGRIGGRNYTWPFVNISLYEEFLVIRCWQSHTIYYSEIKEVKIGKFLFTKGIEISHSNRTAPDFILLYSKNKGRILAMLAEKMNKKI
jgi:hypothetical protein